MVIWFMVSWFQKVSCRRANFVLVCMVKGKEDGFHFGFRGKCPQTRGTQGGLEEFSQGDMEKQMPRVCFFLVFCFFPSWGGMLMAEIRG